MEWDVVIVLGVLVSLFFQIYNPMSRNTKDNTHAMTKLTSALETMSKELEKQNEDMKAFKIENHNSHKRLWDHNTKQDTKIQEHQTKFEILEKGGTL